MEERGLPGSLKTDGWCRTAVYGLHSLSILIGRNRIWVVVIFRYQIFCHIALWFLIVTLEVATEIRVNKFCMCACVCYEYTKLSICMVLYSVPLADTVRHRYEFRFNRCWRLSINVDLFWLSFFVIYRLRIVMRLCSWEYVHKLELNGTEVVCVNNDCGFDSMKYVYYFESEYRYRFWMCSIMLWNIFQRDSRTRRT